MRQWRGVQPMTVRAVMTLGVCGALLGAEGCARPDGTLETGLAALAAPRSGVPRHVSSVDPNGKNDDFRPIAPGQTVTIFDVRGPAVVRRFWITISPRARVVLHRQVILRMYWDDEASPSVEAPIGDFFGVGFGEQRDFVSAPLNETSGGYNCYWPMPFHRAARWTVTNLSAEPVEKLYYNVDFTSYDRLAPELRHFHAQWRRENPTTPGKSYTILEADGQGHFVGTALFMQGLRERALSFLEGNEQIFLDGESRPSIVGTGTEDYFSSGWYFDRGTYSAPYHGVTIKDELNARVSAYRWHIDDAMPFRKSLRVTIEHGHANTAVADYSSVAYYYQVEPHRPGPPLPANPAALLAFQPPLHVIAGAIEGESLIPAARATSGVVEQLAVGAFTDPFSGGSVLAWTGGRSPGDTLDLTLPAPAAGSYEVTGYFAKSDDCGSFQVTFGQRPLGPPLDLFRAAPEVVPSGPIKLGRVVLSVGGNHVVVRLLGKNERSHGYTFGLDALVLEPVH